MKASKHHIDAGMAKSWKHCPRRVWFDVNPPDGLELVEDQFENLLKELGLSHEQRILSLFPSAVPATSAEHTKQLMDEKVAVIYQPILVDNVRMIHGKPDFLLLTDSGEYQIADAKSASSIKGHPEIEIQLGVYRQLLGSEIPAIAYLKNGNVEEVGDEAIKATNKFLTDMAGILSASEPPPTNFGESKCKACPYDSVCRPEFIKRQELSLVYGIDSRSLPELHGHGIHTAADLEASEPEKIADVPYLKGEERKSRAVLQARSFLTGDVIQIKPLKLPTGTWVHFDVEANPLSEPEPNRVYIWGWLPPPYQRESFSFTWSDGSPKDDYLAWIGFLKAVEALRDCYSDLVLAHFSPYETTQIKAYAKFYEMETHPTVTWLLGEDSPMFDILPAIKDALALPLVGYGLKAICKDERLVNFQWELQESGSQWSVVRYVEYLLTTDVQKRQQIKEEILSYNRDDVRATRALEEWLRAIG